MEQLSQIKSLRKNQNIKDVNNGSDCEDEEYIFVTLFSENSTMRYVEPPNLCMAL